MPIQKHSGCCWLTCNVTVQTPIIHTPKSWGRKEEEREKPTLRHWCRCNWKPHNSSYNAIKSWNLDSVVSTDLQDQNSRQRFQEINASDKALLTGTWGLFLPSLLESTQLIQARNAVNFKEFRQMKRPPALEEKRSGAKLWANLLWLEPS